SSSALRRRSLSDRMRASRASARRRAPSSAAVSSASCAAASNPSASRRRSASASAARASASIAADSSTSFARSPRRSASAAAREVRHRDVALAGRGGERLAEAARLVREAVEERAVVLAEGASASGARALGSQRADLALLLSGLLQQALALRHLRGRGGGARL